MKLLINNSLILLVFIALCMVSSCNDPANQNTAPVVLNASLDSSLIDANKYLKRSEEQTIDEFIKRYHWKMSTASNGLRYWIYHSTTGQHAKNKMIATLEFTLSLISGDTCYTSKELGPKRFEIGKYEKESGLNQGVLMMRLGEKAKFILPSNLGFGLMGDGQKIPEKATLIYDIELIKLQ